MLTGRLPSLNVVLLGLTVMSVGCSKAPEDLSVEAKQAVEDARSAGAEEYAPGEYRAAVDALALGETEMAAQSKRFALMRRYQAAATLYQDAIEKARAAEATAKEARTRAQDDADALLVAIRQQIATAHALLESEKGRRALAAPRSGPALDDLRAELADLEASLPAIEEAIRDGNYTEAGRMAQAARDQAQIVEAEILEVLETGRPPRRQK